MKILALDSSAKPASASIFEDEKILGSFYINTEQTHSQTLMPMIEALLKNTCIKIRDIDLFCVSKGPGSFTGIRIGMSVIKGLAIAYNKPCIGISTLSALAYNIKYFNGIICPVMDARCHQVYNALFECKNGCMERLTEDRAIDIDILSQELINFEKIINLVGDGAFICYNELKNKINSINIAPEHMRYQNSNSVAYLAYNHISSHPEQTTSAQKLCPEYLRLSQAERELKKHSSR